MSAFDVMDNLLRTGLVEANDPLQDLQTEMDLLAEGDEALLGLWYSVTGRSLVMDDRAFIEWYDDTEALMEWDAENGGLLMEASEGDDDKPYIRGSGEKQRPLPPKKSFKMVDKPATVGPERGRQPTPEEKEARKKAAKDAEKKGIPHEYPLPRFSDPEEIRAKGGAPEAYDKSPRPDHGGPVRRGGEYIRGVIQPDPRQVKARAAAEKLADKLAAKGKSWPKNRPDPRNEPDRVFRGFPGQTLGSQKLDKKKKKKGGEDEGGSGEARTDVVSRPLDREWKRYFLKRGEGRSAPPERPRREIRDPAPIPSLPTPPSRRTSADRAAHGRDMHHALHAIAEIPEGAKAHELTTTQRDAIGKFVDVHGRAMGLLSHVSPETRKAEGESKQAVLDAAIAKVNRARAKAEKRGLPWSKAEYEAKLTKAKGEASDEWHGSQKRAIASSPEKKMTADALDRAEYARTRLYGTREKDDKYKEEPEPFAAIRGLAKSYAEMHPREKPPADVHGNIQKLLAKRHSRFVGQANKARRDRAAPDAAVKASELSKGGDDGESEKYFDPGASDEESGKKGEGGAEFDPHAHGSSGDALGRAAHVARAHEVIGAEHPEHIAPVLKHRWEVADAHREIERHKALHGSLKETRRALAGQHREALQRHKAALAHMQAVEKSGAHPTVVAGARKAVEQAAEDARLRRNARAAATVAAKHNALAIAHHRERARHSLRQLNYFTDRARLKEGRPKDAYDPAGEHHADYGFMMDTAVKGLSRFRTPDEKEEDASKREFGESVSLFDAIFEAKKEEDPLPFGLEPELSKQQARDPELRKFTSTGYQPDEYSGSALGDKDITASFDRYFSHITNPSARSKKKAELMARLGQLAVGMGSEHRPLSPRSSLKRGKEMAALGVRPLSALEREKRATSTIPPSQRAAFMMAAGTQKRDKSGNPVGGVEGARRPGMHGGALGPLRVIATGRAKKAREAAETSAAIKQAAANLRKIHGPGKSREELSKSPVPVKGLSPEEGAKVQAAAAAVRKAKQAVSLSPDEEAELSRASATFSRPLARAALYAHEKGLKGDLASLKRLAPDVGADYSRRPRQSREPKPKAAPHPTAGELEGAPPEEALKITALHAAKRRLNKLQKGTQEHAAVMGRIKRLHKELHGTSLSDDDVMAAAEKTESLSLFGAVFGESYSLFDVVFA